VGYAKVVAMARRAGLNDAIKPTPAMALGSYETTPFEIAQAYTVFANQGMRVTPSAISLVRAADGSVLYAHQPDAQRALDPRVNYLMVSLLQEVLRSGTGASVRSHGFTLPAAGKTGTSHDGWFAGFTSQLLCVVWVGFDDNRELNLEGAKSALPIWAELMKRAAKMPPYRGVKMFTPPKGVITATACAVDGPQGGNADSASVRRSDVFISGTESSDPCEAAPALVTGGAERVMDPVTDGASAKFPLAPPATAPKLDALPVTGMSKSGVLTSGGRQN
jgi:penicillin-binding protein 1B